LLNQQPPRPDVGNPRLPIDRVFTISGFGVVVTGTLSGGSLVVGQEVEIQPSGVRARIRGLQSHDESIERAEPGQRVAVNLRGVEKSDLARGQVLGLPDAWVPTTLIDAWLRYLPAAQRPLQHDDPVKLFIGAAEVTGNVRVLDREQVNPGEQSWIQIRLERPVVAAYGDRYILRRVSPPETIGGGIILNTAPGQRWKRFRPEVIQRFQTLYEGDPLAVGLLELAQQRGPVRADTLTPAILKSKHVKKMGEWAIHKESWTRIVEKTGRILTNFHAAEPTRQGMPRETLRSRLHLEADEFEIIVNALAQADQIAIDAGTVRLPTHGVHFTSAQEDSIREFWRLVERTPNTPPTVGQARELMGDKPLHSLIEHGDLIRISDDVILPPTVLRDWIAFARGTLERGEPLTVASVRDYFQTTRRYALDFLERLDALGITRRKGDERVLGSGKWDKLL
jgi:selenocysteine-specific elongation factor